MEGPSLSSWKRMFRGSDREARDEMEARRWAYSWEFEVVVETLGGEVGSISDCQGNFQRDIIMSWIKPRFMVCKCLIQ